MLNLQSYARHIINAEQLTPYQVLNIRFPVHLQ